MKSRKQYVYAALAGVCLLAIILDGRTALHGANIGIDLCVRTVIPSLFPFFILSGILSNTIIGKNMPFIRPIGRLCGIPSGSESLLILGFITGYPVGAQLVAQGYKNGNLSYQSAKRMVAFCNHAGPAFIFGILSSMFSRPYISWILWSIQILSGLLIGCLLPEKDTSGCKPASTDAISIQKAMEKAIKTIGTVCGWVIAFRILLSFCDKWFLWRFSTPVQVLISGLLELSNGCIRLSEIANEGQRFILSSILISAGGLCVTMQTMSVAQSVFSSKYFLGKGLQTVFSANFSCIAATVLFPDYQANCGSIQIIGLMGIGTILFVFLLLRKKYVAFQKNLMYNASRN